MPLIVLLSLSACFAFSIQINPLVDEVKPGESISYNITLTNDLSYERTISMYILSDKLVSFFKPSYQVVVPAHESIVVNFLGMVNSEASQGKYYDNIYFDLGGGVSTSQVFSYTIKGPEEFFVLNEVIVPDEVDPRDEFDIVVNFDNGYNERIQKVYAIIDLTSQSGNSLYYSLEVIDVVLGSNNVSIPIKLNSDLPPTRADLDVSISWYDLDFGSVSKSFDIIGYVLNNTIDINSASITTLTNGVELVNNGTLAIPNFDYTLELNNFESWFISSASTDYSITNNAIIFHVPKLLPGESIDLTYNINYTVFYLLPFIIILFVYVSNRINSKISVGKEVSELKSSHDSIVFKVVLNVTNISNKSLTKVKVKEFLPALISDVFDFGTLVGDVKNVDNKRFVVWNLGKLRPNEKTILSYRIKSRMGFIGELKLDNSVVEVFDNNGKIINTEKIKPIIIDVNPKVKTPEHKKETKKKK